MSNGADALAGLLYQQYYLLFELLSSEARRELCDASLTSIERFEIDERVDDGPVWDVSFTFLNGLKHLRECKNTAITRRDRETFYRRIRRELDAGTDAATLTIGWVTDSLKQRGHILAHLADMAELAASDTSMDYDNCPSNVGTGHDALQEALYFLCGPQVENGTTPAPYDAALDLLARLAINDHTYDDLRMSVRLLATGMCSEGTGEAVRKFMVGILSDKITQKEASFDRQGFLDEVGVGSFALKASGRMRDMIVLGSAAEIDAEEPRIVWELLDGRPDITWPVSERLPTWDSSASSIIVASAGIGKSSTIWQAFSEQRKLRDPYAVLRFSASDLDTSHIEVLPELCCTLAGVTGTWIAIDGLDEIPRADQTTWQRTVGALKRIPRLTLILSVRNEVLGTHDWLQQLASGLRSMKLEKLSAEQVRAAFEAVGLPTPNLPSLVKCLRNPFLFSLYAAIATPDELPLDASGEVTAFRIIEEYWQRRVLAASQGLRGGAGEQSSHAKRRAVAYLGDQTIQGRRVLTISTCDSETRAGIDALQNEGVIEPHSSNSVRWSHDWIREYAILDSIRNHVEDLAAGVLADAVSDISHDDVRRAACRASVKFIVAHPEWGTPAGFLNAIAVHDRQLCSEGLALLVEGSDRVLALSELLDASLIIEAITIARQIEAYHWRDQVAELPVALFSSERGSELYATAMQFEFEATSND